MLAGVFRYTTLQALCQPSDHEGMPKYSPAGLTQYVLNNLSKKSPPYHVTQDEVLTPLQILEVEKITGHRFSVDTLLPCPPRSGDMAVVFLEFFRVPYG